MTTIKLNCKMEISGCSNCPFVVYSDVVDYGELTGEHTADCGIITIDDSMNSDCLIYDDEDPNIYYVRDDKLPGCPIISVEEE